MKNNLDFLKALALLSQIGIAIVVPIIAGIWLGNYIDELLKTDLIFLLMGTILGVSAGFRNAYRLIMSQQDDRK